MMIGKQEKEAIFEEKAKEKLEIRFAKEKEWKEAMALAWRTFMQFEAKDYCKRGIESFHDFVTDPILQRMFLLGSYQLFVALEQQQLVGIISLRNETHISLLFVEEAFHKKGVGSALIHYICNYVEEEEGHHHVTVNAAPYAVGFYHKLGFTDTQKEQSSDGIRYTPMKRIWMPKHT